MRSRPLPTRAGAFPLLVLTLFSLVSSVTAAEPFIAEFMPDNARILMDDDGQFSDWIEVQNPNPTPFDLAGYFLTDNPAQLTKWQFPSVTLNPNEALVIFASAKNRTSNTNWLHTNFELNKDGGYLALVKPDGATVASAYSNYPAIKEDVSFGLAQKLITTLPLAATAPQVLVPTNAPGLPADWMQLSFVPDAAWTNGVAPPSVGFDTNQAGGVPVNVAPGGAAIQSTGYNGDQFPASLALDNNFGNFTHTASTDSTAFWQVTLTNEMAIYEVVLFNRGGGCCQWRLRDITIEIVSTNLSGPVTNWISPLLNPENVLGSPAYLSNNLVTILGGPVFGRTIRVHRKADPDLSGGGTALDDQNVLSLGEVVVIASLSGGLKPYVTTDIQNLMFERNPSAFVRLPFNSAETLDTLRLNVRYDDGFVAYLNGVEVAQRNAPASLAFDSSATANRALTNVTMIESIDLSSTISSMVPGTNVLAVQILNYGATNADALFQGELVATRTQRTTNVFLADATPRALNDTESYIDEVKDTHFSVDRGFFTNAFSLSITSGTPDALIYVSFNADEPGPGKGFLYTNALTITNTTIVRARAYKPNWKPTLVDTHTYLFLGDVIFQAPNWQQNNVPPTYFPVSWGANAVDYGMDPNVVSNYSLAQWHEALTQIPSMSVVTEMGHLFDANTGIYANALQQGELWERAASIELLDPTNAVPGRFQENCGLRIRGGFSRNPQFRKHAFRVFFRREYGAGKLNYPLFENEGAQEFDKIDLRTSSNYAWARESSAANGTQDTNVREVWSRLTLGAMGQPYRRSRYYHLYLNGQYWGIYETDERPEASYGATYFGGDRENFDTVKCGNRGTEPDFITEATDGNLMAFSNLWVMCRFHSTNATPSNYFRILGRNPDGSRNPALPVMLDVDNLIDYMIGIFYTGDGDATLSAFLANNRPNNWFGMRDRTNPNVGFRFFNSDCEHTLGAPSSQVDRTGPWRDAAGSNIGNFLYANPQYLHEDLMWNAEYRQLFADHVQKHFFNNGALTLEQATNRWWFKANQISKAIRANSARWGDAVREPPYGESDWTNVINSVANTWFPPRANIVLQQLRIDGLYPSNGAPNFSQTGGAVPNGYSLVLTHTNNSGVVYYTLDGTDPRAIGGGVAPGALAYSGAIVINSPVTVRARVLVNGVWSAVVEFSFFPPQDLSKLLVTEVMYHPPDVGLTDGDDFEFLELKNAGTNTLSLTGLRFTGINFTFTNGTSLAPGQFFVLARNAAQFAVKYPGVTVNGIYSGRQDNAGETITLSHPLGAEVLSVSYGVLAPWPVTPDGFDFSLVPVQPNTNPDFDNPLNWRASTLPGGSPGMDDPPSPIPSILINEVLTHSETTNDFIELFNPTTNTVELGGWFLTDAPGTPKKFRIAEGTQVSPLSYIVFTEADFNATPGLSNSFSLNSHGDDVYLFSGDANTNLTGYSHGFSFNAAPDGETFGRYVISTGEEQFPPQSSATPGLPNAGPRIGPLVITEIMYNPPFPLPEFVEMKNISSNAVSLFDPALPTNAWRFNGIGFTFPTNVIVPPGAVVVISPVSVFDFTNYYSVPPGTLLFGGYTGTLQDSGERLELQRPDVPDTNGFAYINVDEVRYNDKAPWPPAADGSGPSLQKQQGGLYGNDPASWTAAAPTPGSDFIGGDAPIITAQPQSQSVLQGSNATFTVSVSGSAPLNYVWRFRGTNLPNQTNATLVVSNAQLAQAGPYSVSVFNRAGSALSLDATLAVLLPVYFTAQPVSTNVPPGSNVTLVAAAVGNGTLRYQWRFESTNLATGTNAILAFTNANIFEHHGNFSVTVADALSSATSTNAFVYVLARPGIITNPVPVTVLQGGTARFSVLATGAPPMYYRWLRAGGLWESNLFPMLTITNCHPTNSGNFRCTVGNLAGSATTAGPGAALLVLADFDRDGMADIWETNYFGAASTNNANNANDDPDMDGMNNRQEYVANTNPTNAASVLRLATSITNNAVLTFVAQSSVWYSVQYQTSLALTNWSLLTNITAHTSQARTTFVATPFPPPDRERYYRIVTPPVP